ncbi:hypothetical protein R3W88_025138 [Solanum pinnatisectum]|uniref:F-box domain-containing protein n=1 Tax=Solanum pinnatisectum TaxID=50273 RepID=A0AAV9M5A7_9SOLN|nr:hypothetical protein R3W88_025138 [Solanum pinnatisectum]
MKATSDILSDCLIHKILSFLSFKEATKMSVLSKTWLRAWSTHPNLEFEVDYFIDNMKKVDSIIERYRDEKIPIEKFELSNTSFSEEIFPLFDKRLDIALQSGVKDIVFRVPRYTSYTLPIFTILAAKSLRELVLRGFNLKLVSLSSGGVANYNSLRKPSLSSIIVESSKDRVTIKTFTNQHVKIEASTLGTLILFCRWEGYPMLDMINAPNLVSLECRGDKIPKIFVDANLQWNCHPRKVILFTTNKMISCFMDRHSASHESSKPLRNKLQEVTTYKFDWANQNWHPVEFDSGKLTIRKMDKFYFLLDW